MSSCYVHVPFCDSICFYCDFYRKVTKKDIQEKWLKQIIQCSLSELDTLYFGGGTPSCLSFELFQKLCAHFSMFLKNEHEWTLEANPDSLTEEKIQYFHNLGGNRISLGVQSFSDELLKQIGRKHSSKEAIECIERIQKYISNLSIDLMYGLPNQTMEDVKESLDIFFSLKIPHLSIYSLQIEENSVFGKKGILPCEEDLEADMFEYICRRMKENGYEHYEISSFAKPGYYSKHNLAYWQDQDFIGIGCGASGRENGIRYDVDRDLMSFIESGEKRIYISNEDADFEAIMMGLRTQFGVSIENWNQRYHQDLEIKYKNVIQKYSPMYLYLENGYLKPTEKGMEILNSILVDFLEEDC